jgi:hypothetical protein
MAGHVWEKETTVLLWELNVDSHNLKNGWPRLGKRYNSVALLCDFSDAWVFLSS